MLKILQARLQQYENHELPDVQAGFRKGRETRDEIANIQWIIEKAWELRKSIYFCFTDYIKAFDCVDHNKPWKIFKVMGISEHFTCLLRNLYTGIGDTKIGCQILRRWWASERNSRNERGLEKHLLLLYWPRQSLWLCGSQQIVENS